MKLFQIQCFNQIFTPIILILSFVANTLCIRNVSKSESSVSVRHHIQTIQSTPPTTSSDRHRCQHRYDLRPKDLTPNKFRRMKRSFSHQRYIEVMVVADAKMANYHGDNLRQYVLTLMATVELIYRDASIGNAINIALVKLTVMDEEESKDLISASASKTLRHFCRWQHMHNHLDDSHPLHHDTSILLTREDLCRMPSTCDTLGLAQSGQICDPSASCAVIEDNGLSAAFTIAHELGHILSIPHDDDDKCSRFRDGGKRHHIMARMLDYTSHPWTWSACSRHFITEFLDDGNGECLLDKPSVNLIDDIQWHAKRKRFGQPRHTSVLELRQPGELFDMDLQCQLVFGPKSRICPYMPVCKRLWCTISPEAGGCRTQHMPWADGTPCAHNKWCQKGECVNIQKIEAHPVDGQWGPWGSFTECSRTCGGGIQKAIRECDHPKPQFGGKYCTGHRVRYRSCNTHECSATAIDFREEQCRAFDGQTFNINGLTSSVKWTAHYTSMSSDLCKLYCNAVGTGAYYLLKQKVIDGTPCAPDSYDVCVNGKCMNAGCDHILGSQVKPDSCGICAGDNSTCKIISGHLRHVRYGYNLVVTVPVGASNLDVRQYGSSSTDDNYLALRAHDSTYLLNGDFVVSMFHKTLQYGSITIEYSGSNEAVERINTSKPLTSQLYIEVLSVGNLSSPEVSYHYTISLERDKYEWRLNDKWSECSRVCNGEQMLTALCYVANSTKVVDDPYCAAETKPSARAQVCNMHCQLVWKVVKQWQCSASCGAGTKKRLIRCSQQLYNGDHHELHDQYCAHIGTKPEEHVACNGTCAGLAWEYSDWSDCSVSCGQGFQVRSAKCFDKIESIERKPEECESLTPKISKQSCQMDECPHWQTGQWNKCSEMCGTGEKQRNVRCMRSEQVIDDGYCKSMSRPHSVEVCQVKPCSGKWHFGEWSLCENCWSNSQRVVRCRSLGGEFLTDDECDIKEKPIETRDCHYMNANCNNNSVDALQSIAAQPKGQWRTGMWSQCSSSCGVGLQKRYVACLYNDLVLHEHDCDLKSKPDSQQKCEVTCTESPTDLHQWRVGSWGECSFAYEQGLQRRLVRCYHPSGNLVDQSLCDSNKKPNETKVCALAKCDGYWKINDLVEKRKRRKRKRRKKKRKFRRGRLNARWICVPRSATARSDTAWVGTNGSTNK